MSAGYVAVQWNRNKIIYDLVLIGAIFAYTSLYRFVGSRALTGATSISSQILDMRAWGTCAFLMLTLILMIGPAARFDRRFLPLLYNRRHFGVIFFFVAVRHARAVLDYYHNWGRVSRLESLFTFDAAFTSASIPFQFFGVAALFVFLVMALTSHDFWQRLLGGRAWKALHMAVYAGYGLVVIHVAWGALQLEHHPVWIAMVALSVCVVGGLHVGAALRARAADAIDVPIRAHDGEGWLDAGRVADLDEDRPRAVPSPAGEIIAVVRTSGRVHALHGVCEHQGGPLAEGRVVDGCLTCPWHGWQYRVDDGCSPPPFTERLPTYRVAVADDGHVLVRPEPLPRGTPTGAEAIAEVGT